MKLFSGSANREFAEKVAIKLGLNLADASVTRFKDGEIKLSISENVRSEDCFIIQPTCRSIDSLNEETSCVPTVNDNIMELFILTDALKRGSAKSVNLVIPYFGYQRQDRKDFSRAPISAAVVARFIETLNVNRVMIFDLHAGQIAGFFSNNLPVDNLYAEPYFIKFIQNNILTGIDNTNINKNQLIFVAPDAGAVKRNYRVSQKFGVDTCSIYKRRDDDGVIDHMMLIGDVQDKIVIMLDDMIDTGGTICRASYMLKEKGAKKIYVFVTHGLFSGNAIQNIEKSDIDMVVVTNTVPNKKSVFINENGESTKIKMIDISWMCAEAIARLVEGKSISHLYNNYEYFLAHTGS